MRCSRRTRQPRCRRTQPLPRTNALPVPGARGAPRRTPERRRINPNARTGARLRRRGPRPAFPARGRPLARPLPAPAGPASQEEPRHPAPPRRQSRPLRLLRDLNRNCGEPRHRLRCKWQGRHRRRPASLRRRHRRGWLRRRQGWPPHHPGWLRRPAARAGRGTAASDGCPAAAPDGCSAAPDGRASAASGGAGGRQEVPAGCPMLIVDGQIRRVWPAAALNRRDWKAENPALFPCFWLESGYTPRHLTRKHGSKGRPVAAGP